MTWLRSVLAGLVAVTASLLLTAAPASAHVLLAQAQPNGDGTTTLTFTFDHGCDEAPTTELAVSLPAGVSATSTTQPQGWTGQVTIDAITWTGPGIDSGAEARFSAVTAITGTVGQTFHFPTLQRCDNGDFYEWFDSQPGDEYPAPTLIATGAVLAQPAGQVVAADPGSADGGATLPQALGAVAGLVAVAAAAAMFLTRRTPDRRVPTPEEGG